VAPPVVALVTRAPWLSLFDSKRILYPLYFIHPRTSYAGIDSIGMLSLFDSKAPFAWGNWPVLGMWTYCLATWVLVLADTLAYLSLPVPSGPASIEYTDVDGFIKPGQVLGATLLLVGSLIYTAWSKHPLAYGATGTPKADPLLDAP